MLQSYLILFSALVLTVAAQITLKFGMMNYGSVDFSLASLVRLAPRVFTNIYLLGGLVLLCSGLLLWLVVLSRLKLSVVIPFTSFNFILILFFSHFILKESISVLQVIGVVVIILGLFLITR